MTIPHFCYVNGIPLCPIISITSFCCCVGIANKKLIIDTLCPRRNNQIDTEISTFNTNIIPHNEQSLIIERNES